MLVSGNFFSINLPIYILFFLFFVFLIFSIIISHIFFSKKNKFDFEIIYLFIIKHFESLINFHTLTNLPKLT